MSSWWVCTTEGDTRGTSPLLYFGLDETFWVRNVESETLVVKKISTRNEHLFKKGGRKVLEDIPTTGFEPATNF